MSITDWLKQLYLWQYHKQEMEAFYFYVVHAYRHADGCNKRNIGKGFPELLLAMELWDKHGNEVFEMFEVSEKNIYELNGEGKK